MDERNRPTPEGRVLGAMLANAVDDAEPLARLEAPSIPPRCKSCAARGGSFPNGCPETLIDFLQCVGIGRPFYCHQHHDADGNPTHLCSGWLMGVYSERLKMIGKLSHVSLPILDRPVPEGDGAHVAD